MPFKKFYKIPETFKYVHVYYCFVVQLVHINFRKWLNIDFHEL